MKRKFFLLLVVILIDLSYFGYMTYEKQKVKEDYTVIEQVTENYELEIQNLKEQYHNEDVTAILEISDTLIPVVQTNDNEYYLTHAYDKSYSRYGAPFMDYRSNWNSSKILIFSHSVLSMDLPFEIIQNYKDQSYFEEHRYISLITEKEKRIYEVFSAYVETEDFDYMKMDFTLEEKQAHYQKLKNHSFYDTGVEVSKEDDILILQTCSEMEEYKNYKIKYFLVLAKRIS